jgi:sigma-B regulation protein RsbU (phosphoserine phosphatase)
MLVGSAGSAAAAGAGPPLVVGLYPDPPLIFTDAKGHVRGVAADILAVIARRRKWDLRYIPGSREQCIRRLQTGAVDLVPGLAAAEPLVDRFAFGTEAIVTDWGQLYIRPQTPFGDILDLQGQPIAVAEADGYARFFKTVMDRFEVHPRYVTVGDYRTALSLVQQKKVFAAVVSRIYGDYVAQDFGVIKSPISFMPTKLRFAVADGRHADLLSLLDRRLRQLKSHPGSEYYQSLNRWIRGVRQVTVPLGRMTLWIAATLVGIMGLIILGNVFLRRQVRLRTNTLKEAIAEKEKIESELAVAREIQLQLVPDNSGALPRRKEFDIYACLEPAREVGGDFYDYFFIDRNSLCLVIGDVSGKGVPAALFMAMTKTMIKSAARLLMEPEYILADVNREIAANNPSLTFVTVFLGVLDLNTGMLTYASAGHNPPLFLGKKGNAVFLADAQCPAIGLDDTFQFRQATVRLRHKEGLLFFTDGVTEARDPENRMFTPESLMNTLSLTAELTPEQRVRAILSRIREFTGNRPLDDDLTLLAMTYFSPNRVDHAAKTIVLKNDIHEMGRIIAAINGVATSIDCPPVVVHDITLAIEEIFSNIVFYGFGDDLDHTITFDVDVDGDTLILTLQDRGIPFNPLNVRIGRPDKPLEERDQGGMGIILARNLVDQMEYRREQGKNVLRMQKRFR